MLPTYPAESSACPINRQSSSVIVISSHQSSTINPTSETLDPENHGIFSKHSLLVSSSLSRFSFPSSTHLNPPISTHLRTTQYSVNLVTARHPHARNCATPPQPHRPAPDHPPTALLSSPPHPPFHSHTAHSTSTTIPRYTSRSHPVPPIPLLRPSHPFTRPVPPPFPPIPRCRVPPTAASPNLRLPLPARPADSLSAPVTPTPRLGGLLCFAPNPPSPGRAPAAPRDHPPSLASARLLAACRTVRCSSCSDPFPLRADGYASWVGDARGREWRPPLRRWVPMRFFTPRPQHRAVRLCFPVTGTRAGDGERCLSPHRSPGAGWGLGWDQWGVSDHEMS